MMDLTITVPACVPSDLHSPSPAPVTLPRKYQVEPTAAAENSFPVSMELRVVESTSWTNCAARSRRGSSDSTRRVRRLDGLFDFIWRPRLPWICPKGRLSANENGKQTECC